MNLTPSCDVFSLTFARFLCPSDVETENGVMIAPFFLY